MLSPTLNDQLQQIVNRVFRLQGAMLRYGDRVGSRYGITGSQWQVLSVLRRGPSSVASIARMIDLKRQSVQRTADLLVGQRLLTMVPNPANARSPLATLTDTGQRVASSLAREQRTLLARCAGDFSPAELAVVERCLEAMHSQVDGLDGPGRAKPGRTGSRVRTRR